MKIRFKQAAIIFMIIILSTVITGFFIIDQGTKIVHKKYDDDRTERNIQELHHFNRHQPKSYE